MAANEIKIVIGGDAKGFQLAAGQASAAAKGMQTQLSRIPNASNQATAALTDIGRVAQDVPFGFVAISNNLNPLLESFGRLKQETGSAGAAFKALAGSLTGAGGLGLAVSLVTSALTLASVGFGSWTRGFSESSEAAKKASEANKEFKESIDNIRKEAAGQAVQIGLLVAEYSKSNSTQGERVRIIEQLKRVSPDYFGQLNTEKTSIETLSKAYSIYNQNILKTVEAKILSGQLEKLVEQRIAKQKELNDLQTNGAESEVLVNGKLVKARNFVLGATKNQNQLQAEINGMMLTEADLLSKITSLKSAEVKTGNSQQEVDLLKQRIDALKELQSTIGLTRTQLSELTDLQKNVVLRDGIKLGFKPEEIKDRLQAIELENYPLEIREVIITNIGALRVDSKAISETKAFTEGFQTDIAKATGNLQIEIGATKFTFTNLKDQAEIARQQLVDTLFTSLTSGIEDAASLVGETLGNLFSGESLGSSFAKAAQGLLGIVGGVLQQVGKQMIATSQAVEALKVALNGLFAPGGGAAGIAAGLLLIGTGALLKNIKFDVPKFAEGGIVNRATLGLFGERGPEAIMPLDKIPQLMGRLNFANQQPIILQPSLRYSMTDFQIAIEQVDSTRRRLG